MEIKLLKKGIKVNGKYYPAWYSSCANNINGNATIYLRTYDRLPVGFYNQFEIVNDSDIMTDYFEKDKIRIKRGSKFFDQVEALAGTYSKG